MGKSGETSTDYAVNFHYYNKVEHISLIIKITEEQSKFLSWHIK